ncbi:MAG: hypothetical protein QME96_12490 [Myxococcota bacterium]|nr:hypothetical protein [Myxococcota bacterium]
MDFGEFVTRHLPRLPSKPHANEDELRRLRSEDGVRLLDAPPPEATERHVPAKRGDPGCHLWVIDGSGMPYILERAPVAPPLKSGTVKHTNLTGGAAASAGGEIWFDPAEDHRVYVNGCSGRYVPRTPQEMDDVAAAVQGLGYEVVNFGWEADTNRPAAVLRK